MTDMNDIENLFASNLGGEEITPPASVKANIDKELFPGKKGGIMRLWPVLLLCLIGSTVGIYFWVGNDLSNTDQAKVAQNEEKELVENEQEGTDRMITSNSTQDEIQITNDQQSPENTGDFNETGSTQVFNTADNAFNATEDAGNAIDRSGNSGSDQGLSNSGIGSTDGITRADGGNTRRDNGSRSVNSMSATNDVTNNGGDFVESDDSDHLTDGQSDQQEARGMDITSKMETLPLSAIDNPISSLEKQAYSPKPEARKKLMNVRVYAGMNDGVGNVVSTVQPVSSVKKTTVSEGTSFSFGAEYGYDFTHRIGLSGGLEYCSNTAEVIEHDTTQQNVLVNSYWEYIYNNPVTQDSIIDSNYVNVYDQVINDVTEASIVKTQSLSIPVYFKYNMSIANSMNLSLYGGFRFNYLNQKFLDENGAMSNPTLNKFSVSMLFRPELTYNIHQFGIGLYGRFGYDLKSGMQWETMRRNRYEVGGGIVLKYQF